MAVNVAASLQLTARGRLLNIQPSRQNKNYLYQIFPGSTIHSAILKVQRILERWLQTKDAARHSGFCTMTLTDHAFVFLKHASVKELLTAYVHFLDRNDGY